MYSTEADLKKYELLDKLFIENGSDKGSNGNNYSFIYSKFFDQIRNEKLKFLEIGIFKEGSVRAWEAYFPNAELHFIDIEAKENHSSRSHYHVADQGNPHQLEYVIEQIGGKFDIVIDDGLHFSWEQITSFETFFPHMKNGGIYVIEDLCWCLHQRSRPKNQMTTFDYLKRLIDEINFVTNKFNKGSSKGWLDKEEIQAELNPYRKDVAWLIVQECLAIITKK